MGIRDMATLVTINSTDDAHLAGVIETMRSLGSPTIRCIADPVNGIILALEGSHRIAAAAALDLPINVVMLADSARITAKSIGYDDMGAFEGKRVRAASFRELIGSPMGMYRNVGSFYRLDDGYVSVQA